MRYNGIGRFPVQTPLGARPCLGSPTLLQGSWSPLGQNLNNAVIPKVVCGAALDPILVSGSKTAMNMTL